MNYNQFLVWNARGLNSRACRTVVRDIIVQERVSVVCLQETKVDDFSVSMINERHGLQDTADCALCAQEDETVDHLLISCVYARGLWSCLLHRFD